METDEIIAQLDNFQARLFIRRNGQVEPADPTTLSNNLLLIRGLLIQLVDKVADTELLYRKSKAARYDSFLTAHKPGEKGLSKSAAMDKLDMEDDLIDMKITSERIKNYMKFTDGLCTSIQSVLKVMSSSEKNQY